MKWTATQSFSVGESELTVLAGTIQYVAHRRVVGFESRALPPTLPVFTAACAESRSPSPECLHCKRPLRLAARWLRPLPTATNACTAASCRGWRGQQAPESPSLEHPGSPAANRTCGEGCELLRCPSDPPGF